MNRKHSDENEFRQDAYENSLDLLRQCCTQHGFVASPAGAANYNRIWGRDSVIIGLAALASGEEDLIDCFKNSLLTLAAHQGPHGEIPSNVDPNTERISYGGMAGRVDANLLFIIGCGEYWIHSGDDAFLNKMMPVIEKTSFLLECWEFNNRGLLYIPQTGDWADEYLHHGYVLYDQILYLQAKRCLRAFHRHLHGSPDHSLIDSISQLKRMIQVNYWMTKGDEVPDEAYHEVIYQKGMKIDCDCKETYWLPYFSPHGYGYRFDAFANVLMSLFDLADESQRDSVDTYIDSIVEDKRITLLPAFHPVIKPVDESDWQDLRMTFSYSFKNHPYEYHNGGLWPMITGFYAAALAKHGQIEKAESFLDGINQANAMSQDYNGDWGFSEYIHGSEFTPCGEPSQGWSAAGAVIAHKALVGAPVFRIDGEKAPGGE